MTNKQALEWEVLRRQYVKVLVDADGALLKRAITRHVRDVRSPNLRRRHVAWQPRPE